MVGLTSNPDRQNFGHSVFERTVTLHNIEYFPKRPKYEIFVGNQLLQKFETRLGSRFA